MNSYLIDSVSITSKTIFGLFQELKADLKTIKFFLEHWCWLFLFLVDRYLLWL
jgi:hypothetical protein